MLDLPNDWVFQIAVTLGTFWLSAGLAYCLFRSEQNANDARHKSALTADQFYLLATINKNMTNALRVLNKWKLGDDVITLDLLLTEIDHVMADSLFEIWHLEPAISHSSLANDCVRLEELLNEFRMQTSNLQGYIRSPITLDSIIGDELEKNVREIKRTKAAIDKHEARIRDEYRRWLGKAPLEYTAK